MDALRRAGLGIVSDVGDGQPRDLPWFQLDLELLWISHGAIRVKSKCAPHSVQCEIQLHEGGRKHV